MTWDTLLWLFLANAVLVLVHEIDSTSWREADLLRIPGGLALSLALHVPLLVLVVGGLLAVQARTVAGLGLSAALAAGGVCAFAVHAWRGRPGLPTFASRFVLGATLLASLAQAVVTVRLALMSS